jgi:hypothetical protein
VVLCGHLEGQVQNLSEIKSVALRALRDLFAATETKFAEQQRLPAQANGI